MKHSKKTIVCACSSSSNLAKIAYDIALNIASDGIADFVDVCSQKIDPLSLSEISESGRAIIAIDSCEKQCVKNCLAMLNITADHYFELSQFGLHESNQDQLSLVDSCMALRGVYQHLFNAGFSIQSGENKS